MDTISLTFADGRRIEAQVLVGEAGKVLDATFSIISDACAEGAEIFLADPGNLVRVGDYREDIHWYRDLLALRYSEDMVSPVRCFAGLSILYFTFSAKDASERNQRWNMYGRIP